MFEEFPCIQRCQERCCGMCGGVAEGVRLQPRPLELQAIGPLAKRIRDKERLGDKIHNTQFPNLSSAVRPCNLKALGRSLVPCMRI